MVAYRYFSCVPGRVAHRFGTKSLIGAVRGKLGYEWNEAEVVPLPASELRRYLREYNRLLRGPKAALIERSRADYEAYAEKQGFDPVADSGICNIDVTNSARSKSSKKGRKPTDSEATNELVGDGSAGGEE
jgi:hypothetical protein